MEHEAHGWDAGSWHASLTPGYTIAGADVLATAEHKTTNLGGVIVGWDSSPAIGTRPCIGIVGMRNCTTKITQI